MMKNGIIYSSKGHHCCALHISLSTGFTSFCFVFNYALFSSCICESLLCALLESYVYIGITLSDYKIAQFFGFCNTQYVQNDGKTIVQMAENRQDNEKRVDNRESTMI